MRQVLSLTAALALLGGMGCCHEVCDCCTDICAVCGTNAGCATCGTGGQAQHQTMYVPAPQAVPMPMAAPAGAPMMAPAPEAIKVAPKPTKDDAPKGGKIEEGVKEE
jgi:hypothetical protein